MFLYILKQWLILSIGLSMTFGLATFLGQNLRSGMTMLAYYGPSVVWGFSDVYLMDTDYRLNFVVSTMNNGTELEWTPDGENLLLDLIYPSNEFTSSEVYRADIYGTSLTRVKNRTSGVTIDHIQWSPDGETILYRRNRNSTRPPSFSYVVADADWKEIALIDLSGLVNGMIPAWSPDSTKIAFVRAQATHDIVIIDARNGTLVEQIETDETDEMDEGRPIWSPDGTKIAFTAEPAGSERSAHLFTFDLQTREIRQLTHLEQGSIGTLSWSPDGQYIAFNFHVRDASNGMSTSFVGLYAFENDMALIDPRPASYIFRDAWSSDGEWLVYMSSVREANVQSQTETEMFRKHIATDTIQQLTFGDQWATNPKWRPQSP